MVEGLTTRMKIGAWESVTIDFRSVGCTHRMPDARRGLSVARSSFGG